MTNDEKHIMSIRCAFKSEVLSVKDELEQLHKAVNSSVDRIMVDDNKDNLQEHISTLQDICFFLKSVCSEANLYVKLLTPEAINETKTEGTMENKTSEDVEPEQADDLNKTLPYERYSEVFTYSTIDPAKYPVGFVGKFSVTYIKDDEKRNVFVTEIPCPVIEQLVFRYNDVPDAGIVFGILLEDSPIRVVRENQLKIPAIKFRVLSIDLGIILEISKKSKMYKLPDILQEIPGQAIFSKLTMNDNCDDQKFLKDILCSDTQTIRIENIIGNMLEVTVNPTKNSQMSFESLNLTGDNTSVHDGHSYKESMTWSTCFDVNNNVGLTQENHEEQHITENSLEAINGYPYQVDKRFCKITNVNAYYSDVKMHPEMPPVGKKILTGDKASIHDGHSYKESITSSTCFDVNSNVGLLQENHEEPLITENSLEAITNVVYSEVKMHPEMPPVGKKIFLLISYVNDVEKFYGQIIPDCDSAASLTVEKIAKEMNDINMTSKLKPFMIGPAPFELVFAMFTDNLWYRAKILLKTSDARYKVLYVDYGNCSVVTVDRLRKWEDELYSYPFQALECKLDNVIKISTDHKDATAYFASLVLNKPVEATVTYNVGGLHVTLQDKTGSDIGEQLYALEYAQHKPKPGPFTVKFLC